MGEARVTKLPNVRPGTAVGRRWFNASLGMTVAELIAAGATTGDLKYFAATGRMEFDADPGLPEWKPRPKARHGGPRTPRHQAKGDTTIRPCMCCHRPFPSDHRFDRLCDRCRSLA